MVPNFLPLFKGILPQSITIYVIGVITHQLKFLLLFGGFNNAVIIGNNSANRYH